MRKGCDEGFGLEGMQGRIYHHQRRKADIRADMMREVRTSVRVRVVWGCLLDIQADVSCWQLDV